MAQLVVGAILSVMCCWACQAAAAPNSGKPAAALASVLTVLKRAASVTPKNLSLDEREPVLTLTCTVGYSNFGAVFWTLYDRDLRDIGHVEESSALMDDGRTIAKVSVLRIGGWQASVQTLSASVLPTESGAYPFKCNTFADFKVASDTALVHSQLTDTCTPSDGKCEARGARCVQGRCACVDERHPLRLRSLHTVCWPKVRAKRPRRAHVVIIVVPEKRVAVLVTPGEDKRILLAVSIWGNNGSRQCRIDCAGYDDMQEQCSAAGHSECVVNLGWCACREGFARSADSCKAKPEGGLWARCARHADCRSANARCVYSHCECPSGTLLATKDATECLNATTVAMASPEKMLAPAAAIPWHLAPMAALQEAPEVPSFGKPHKHIRDSPIDDD
ncbi:hypothetical protein HPB52_023125 [Rhipicephalus sanguineus]|uniref:EB domain-containing protein n=1 Tax=Rhipicephalus sanguineus TaxID=34632 RepID=A0A9D4QH70_RHISA|nr:hypothetical protein HPB52_023125 [Rhipicephalus sanguineus]